MLLGLGILILTIISIDILTTILKLSGGGTISNRISKFIWRIFNFIAGNNPRSKFLNYAGVFILVSLFIIYVFGLWVGYSLIYLSDPGFVVNTSNELPVHWIGKIYYLGYNLISLENGDLKSGNDAWRIIF